MTFCSMMVSRYKLTCTRSQIFSRHRAYRLDMGQTVHKGDLGAAIPTWDDTLGLATIGGKELLAQAGTEVRTTESLGGWAACCLTGNNGEGEGVGCASASVRHHDSESNRCIFFSPVLTLKQLFSTRFRQKNFILFSRSHVPQDRRAFCLGISQHENFSFLPSHMRSHGYCCQMSLVLGFLPLTKLPQKKSEWFC